MTKDDKSSVSLIVHPQCIENLKKFADFHKYTTDIWKTKVTIGFTDESVKPTQHEFNTWKNYTINEIVNKVKNIIVKRGDYFLTCFRLDNLCIALVRDEVNQKIKDIGRITEGNNLLIKVDVNKRDIPASMNGKVTKKYIEISDYITKNKTYTHYYPGDFYINEESSLYELLTEKYRLEKGGTIMSCVYVYPL